MLLIKDPKKLSNPRYFKALLRFPPLLLCSGLEAVRQSIYFLPVFLVSPPPDTTRGKEEEEEED